MATAQNDFDPYHKWLGIPSKDQPPNHYRLLGLENFESDLDVIEIAANKQMAYLRRCATGERAHHAEKLLTELTAARHCLLDFKKKAAYDAQLDKKVGAESVVKLCYICGVDVAHTHRTKDSQGHYYCDACWMAKSSPKKEVEADPLAALAAAQTTKPAVLSQPAGHKKTLHKVPGKSPKKSHTVAILSVIAVVMLVGIFAGYYLLTKSTSESESSAKNAPKTGTAIANGTKEPDYPMLPRGSTAGELFPSIKNQPTTPQKPLPRTPNINIGTTDQTKPAAPAIPPVKPDESPTGESVKPAPESPAVTKLPIPPAAALKAAMQIVNDAYQSQVIAAKTPQDKAALAAKLLQDAMAEKDTVAQFALLTKAKDISITLGDFEAVSAVIDQLDSNYQIDSLKMRTNAALAISDMIQYADQVEILIPQMCNIVDDALAADRYDIAISVTECALNVTRLTKAVELQRIAAYKARKVHETQAAYIAIKPALATLAIKPTDPDANLKVGKFQCFIKGNWDGGLPMLAQGGDAALKALAKQEITRGTDVDSQMMLGDGWWAMAEKETGMASSQIKKHAGMWYSQAAPTLAFAAKVKVNARLNTIVDDDSGGIVNLLKLVDVAKDTGAGNWVLLNGTLTSDNAIPATIQLPYQPPAEYDYRIVFTRIGNTQAILCTAMGHQFCLQIGSGPGILIGFATVGGKEAHENLTTVHPPKWLVKGLQCTVIMKVRKGGVQAFMNDQLITQWKTDYSDMGPSIHWQLPHIDTIGLGTWGSPTIFSSASIIEITGKGHVLKREDH